MASLKKQFQKELKTNPKKAATLGLLAVVAIYFWFPLAIKLATGGKKTKSSKTAVASSSSPDAATETKQPDAGKKTDDAAKVVTTPSFGWDQLLEWIQKDPLTETCEKLQNDHDPFERVEKTIELPPGEKPLAARSGEQSTEQTPEVVRDLSPAAIGMQLSSTIVGKRRSVAMIDDRAYALGQRVVGFDGATPLPFKLVQILPEAVVLERDKQQYVLKIKQTDDLEVSVEDDGSSTGL